MHDEIKVSIICLAYNHEKYIRDALDGFIMQKTNFKYEIIIHDDASTDNTVKIISEYADKHPDLFVTIFQSENKYSQKINILSEFIYPKVRGKYIAFCEGDDFWTDQNKLQKQVDFLEANPDYTACTHAHSQIDMRSKEIRDFHAFNSAKTATTQEIIEGDGHFFATNSLVCKSNITVNLPDFRKNAPVGDYPLMIHLAFEGKVYFMNEVMSTYRYMAPGSWSANNLNKNGAIASHIKKIEKTLNEADTYSNGKFHDSFTKIIRKKWFYYHKTIMSLNELKRNYPDYYNKCSFKDKLFIFIRSHFPILIKLYYLLKGF